MTTSLGSRWEQLAQEVITGMREWRQAHPRATLTQMEQALDERLARVRARMLEDMALASSAADWSTQSEDRRPLCQDCGMGLQRRGKRRRRLQTQGGQQITLERQYATCPGCGRGFFPPR